MKNTRNSEFIHDNSQKKIKYPDTVLAVCAINATLKTIGVAGLSGNITDSLSQTILGKESLSKGVKVNQTEEGIVFDIYVIVNDGVKIPEIAWDIQKNINRELKNITDQDVKKVNIHVQGVQGVRRKTNEKKRS